MKKLDEAIDRVTGIHVVRAGQPAPLAVWMAFHSAVLALLAAIAEWRKGPRVSCATGAMTQGELLDIATRWRNIAESESLGDDWNKVEAVLDFAGDSIGKLVAEIDRLRALPAERRADGVVYAPWFPGPRPAEMAVVADCTCVSIGPRDSVLDHDDHCDLYDRVPMSEVLAEEDRIAAENATARARDAAPLDELDMLRLAADAPPTEPVDDAEAMMANVGARLRENAASRRARKP